MCSHVHTLHLDIAGRQPFQAIPISSRPGWSAGCTSPPGAHSCAEAQVLAGASRQAPCEAPREPGRRGAPMTTPQPPAGAAPGRSASAARTSAAACAGVSTRAGAAQPLARAKKAGKSSAPYAATHTPCRTQ